MESAALGKLTDEELVRVWVQQRDKLRETYPGLHTGEEIPTADTLRKLAGCRATAIHNSSCFSEGFCVAPKDHGCGYKQGKV